MKFWNTFNYYLPFVTLQSLCKILICSIIEHEIQQIEISMIAECMKI